MARQVWRRLECKETVVRNARSSSKSLRSQVSGTEIPRPGSPEFFGKIGGGDENRTGQHRTQLA